MRKPSIRFTVTTVVSAFLFAACGGGGSSIGNVTPPPPPAPAAITATGVIYDGPVVGGTLFVYGAADVEAAITAASGAADRVSALAGANPLAQLARDSADGEAFTLDISGDLAGEALFFVFDSDGAEDQTFGDQPFNLEAVAIAGDAGSQLRINLTPHTTTSAIEVRSALDPDGDGVPIDAAAIASALQTALGNAQGALGVSALGEDLFPSGEDPHATEDQDVLTTASTELGRAVRKSAGFSGLSMDDVIFLFAADAADGVLDGAAPVSFGLSTDRTDDLAAVANAYQLGRERMTDVEDATCSASNDSLRRACEYESLDEFFIGAAVCAHSETEEDADLCLEDYAADRDEALDVCGEIDVTRLELCEATGNAIHDPAFGADFAANFIDPLTIGDTSPTNPYFPMAQGSVWTYEGTFEEDGETITEVVEITVTDRIKFVDGIRCLVVRDVVTIDGELVEDTDDWFAQDTDGNIWYCGEEAKDFEFFDGDEPALPELVAIDGSFKAGRDGDEAGILLPFAPVAGDVFRQEVSFANAEDVIEILGIDRTETVPAAVCSGTCLATRDFSPLDPGSEETKFYAPGIGKILEIDNETGDRVELISYTVP